jgi:hypothetical protein
LFTASNRRTNLAAAPTGRVRNLKRLTVYSECCEFKLIASLIQDLFRLVIAVAVCRSDHRLASYAEICPLDLSPELVIGYCDARKAVVVQDSLPAGSEIRFFGHCSVGIAADNEFCIAMLLLQRLTIDPEIRRFDVFPMAILDKCDSGKTLIVQDRLSVDPKIRYFDHSCVWVIAAANLSVTFIYVHRFFIYSECREFKLIASLVKDIFRAVIAETLRSNYWLASHTKIRLFDCSSELIGDVCDASEPFIDKDRLSAGVEKRLFDHRSAFVVEKRAAVETGQEQENVNLTGQISAKSIALSKVMSLEELEALEAKMLAVMEAERTGKVIEAPTTTTTNKPKEPRSGDAEAKPLG